MMFKDLFSQMQSSANALKSTVSLGYQPDLADLSAGIVSYQRYIESGTILVSDSLLEQRLSAVLLKNTDILDVAIYGFEKKLCLSVVAVYKNVEILIEVEIKPIDVVWTDQHIIRFDVDIVSVTSRDEMMNLGASTLKNIAKNFIPFGGLISELCSYSVGKIAANIGLTKCKEFSEVSGRGISWEDNRVCVDMSLQPELAPLYQKIPDMGISNLLGHAPRMIDQIQVISNAADREGLLFQVKLGAQADLLFQSMALLGQNVQSLIGKQK